MFIGGDLSKEMILSRVLVITGSLSAGKTRLAIHLWYHYFRGYSLYANIPLSPSLSRPLPPTFHHSYVVLDEGGVFVREAKLASKIIRSAGKADYFVVFSGRRQPHKDLSELVIEPVFDFFRNFGVPALLWRYSYFGGRKSYTRLFLQLFPQVVHGLFDTYSPSEGIDAFLPVFHRTLESLGGKVEEYGSSVSEVISDAFG